MTIVLTNNSVNAKMITKAYMPFAGMGYNVLLRRAYVAAVRRRTGSFAAYTYKTRI